MSGQPRKVMMTPDLITNGLLESLHNMQRQNAMKAAQPNNPNRSNSATRNQQPKAKQYSPAALGANTPYWARRPQNIPFDFQYQAAPRLQARADAIKRGEVVEETENYGRRTKPGARNRHTRPEKEQKKRDEEWDKEHKGGGCILM
jgi:hypothetical protein